MKWTSCMLAATVCFSCGGQDNDSDACTAPEPLVAGTAQTNVIADAPARCGQPNYQWLRNGVGRVVSVGEARRTGLEMIQALVKAQGLSLPSPPSHTAVLTTYTYTTQDRGELIEATALFAYPEGLDPLQGAGTLLFMHGTMGLEDGCSASDDLETRLLAAMAASLGYDVVVPDLLGLKASGEPTGFLHPYLIGEPTALASLDAVRAAMRLEPAARGKRCVRPEIVIIGASQGGHAGLFVERYAPVYARELSIQGVAVAVPPAALHAQFLHKAQDDQPENGFLLAGVTAMADWYGVSDGLTTLFKEPWPENVPNMLLEECDLFRTFDIPQTKEELFTSELLAAVAQDRFPEPWDCILRENDMFLTKVADVASKGDRPGTLLVTGESDEYVETSIERESYTALCDEGLPVRYLECQDASHEQACIWAMSEAMQFLADRASGQPLEDPCTDEPVAMRCSGTP